MKFYSFIFFVVLIVSVNKTTAQYANTALSNLTTTSINQSLLVNRDNSYTIGNTSKAWKSIYIDSALYISGHRFLTYKTGTGANNTAMGMSSLTTNTTGTDNTAIGFNTLTTNTTGRFNTALGSQAMSNTTASYNTAVGTYALSNSQANNNTALGFSAMIYTSTGARNTAIGQDAMHQNLDGEDNTVIGNEALSANTSGLNNVAIGSFALTANTTAGNNTAIGEEALYSNTTGIANTATGSGALSAVKVNSYNTANGFFSLKTNTGTGNTAMGSYSLFYNSSGNNNTAVGYNTLYYNTTLSGLTAVGNDALTNVNGGKGGCTALGANAGVNNTDGSYNTYVGYHAGNTVTYGNSNTIIGYGSDVSNAAVSNATAIGNFAVSDASNRVRIGNSSVTSIGGQVGWTSFSDERIKTNIKQNVPGLAFINLLKPVTYNFDLDKQQQLTNNKNDAEWNGKYDIQKIQFTGFLAQDVATAAKKINYDFSGVDAPADDKGVYGLRYSDFVVPLVKAVQELSKQNDSLKKDNNDMKSEINYMKTEIENIKISIAANNSTVNSERLAGFSAASIQQNIPNPFLNSTSIKYNIPQQFASAKIIITDINGNALQQFTLTGNNGSLIINAATLTSGAYQYSLYVDGKLIATKQMVLSK